MTANELQTCEDVQFVLPWKINGTLSPEMLKNVTFHLQSCEECRKALEEEIRLAAALVELDDETVRRHASWSNIEAALDDANVARTTRTAFKSNQRGWLALAATVAAFGIFVGVWQHPTTEPNEFVTLTSPTAEVVNGQIEIRVLPVSPGFALDVGTEMEKLGVENITGPSSAGLFRGVLAEDSLQTVLAILERDPRIALAVAGEPE